MLALQVLSQQLLPRVPRVSPTQAVMHLVMQSCNYNTSAILQILWLVAHISVHH